MLCRQTDVVASRDDESSPAPTPLPFASGPLALVTVLVIGDSSCKRNTKERATGL